MPQAAIAVLAKVFIYYGVQAAIAKFAATIFVYAASAYLLNRASKSLEKKARSQGAISSSEINYYNSGAPIRIGYGRIRTGGMETIPPLVGANNNKILHKVLTLTGHEVDSFNMTMFDANTIDNSTLRAMAYTSSDGQVTTGTYSGHAFIRHYRGTSTDSADKLLVDYDSQTFINFRGRSFAKVALSFVYNADIFKQVPEVTFTYQAKRCYDPRLDITPGGDVTNAAYARWGTAGAGIPALALTDYLMSDYGGSYDSDDIDWDTVVTAANYCDALVPTAFPFFGVTASAGISTSGSTYTKTGATGAYDAGVYTTGVNSYSGTGRRLRMTWRVHQTNARIIVGLNNDPTTDHADTGINFGILARNDGIIEIKESGVSRGTFGSYTTGTIFGIEYYNRNLVYTIDGLPVRIVGATTTTLFLDSSFYDNGGSVTFGARKRYTCNGMLQATDKFEDNVKALTNSMLGRVIFRDGKWRIYAGSWKTPTFSIQKSDFVSSVSVKFEQGKAKRFNRMHCWFIDPDREWQREECYPRSNPLYVTADKGEVIDAEFEDLLCTNEDEAQGKAEMLLKQSRNQIVISGRLPPRFQDIATWDTGTVNIDGFGWTSKTFRAIALDINPDGSVDAVFCEEQSADWDDLEEDDYDYPSYIPVPATNVTTPSEPLNFSAARQINGTILFDWNVPAVFPTGSGYEIIRSTNTLVSGGVNTTIWSGFAKPVAIVCPTSRHWYFSRARSPQGVLSDYSPNTFGLGVNARLEADQTLQFRLVGDSEFEFTESASLWKNEMFFQTNTAVGGNLLVTDSYATHVGTAIYSATGGQFGGYVRLQRLVNSLFFQQNFIPYNEQQPTGIPYNGKAFAYQLDLRFRVNSIYASTAFSINLFARFSTPNTAVFYSRIVTINVTSSDMDALGAWTTYRRTGVVNYPTEPLTAADITSGFAHTLIPAIATANSTMFDVDYFQMVNLGHTNYPVESKPLGGSSNISDDDSMNTIVMANSFVNAQLVVDGNPTNAVRFDWRKWQIGRIIEVIKPQTIRPVHIIPGTTNPPTLILAGRIATGTVTMSTSAFGNASIEKVSATELFISGNGLS
jgi:hypothetical protein